MTRHSGALRFGRLRMRPTPAPPCRPPAPLSLVEAGRPAGAVSLAALLLFESVAARDLRIFAQALHADVPPYRDATGLEADAVVERRDGTWAAFEVKLGPGAVEEAARRLLRLADLGYASPDGAS